MFHTRFRHIQILLGDIALSPLFCPFFTSLQFTFSSLLSSFFSLVSFPLLSSPLFSSRFFSFLFFCFFYFVFSRFSLLSSLLFSRLVSSLLFSLSSGSTSRDQCAAQATESLFNLSIIFSLSRMSFSHSTFQLITVSLIHSLTHRFLRG